MSVYPRVPPTGSVLTESAPNGRGPSGLEPYCRNTKSSARLRQSLNRATSLHEWPKCMKPQARSRTARTTAIGSFSCWLTLAVAVLALAPPELPAAEAPTAPQVSPRPDETVTAERIQAHKKEIEEATDLDAELKLKVLQAYEQANVLLEASAKATARAAFYQDMIGTAPAEKERVERELKELAASKAATPTPSESLESLKTTRVAKETELAKAKENLAAMESEVARRVSAGQEIPKLTADARTRLSKVEEKLRTPFAAETPPPLIRAQTASLLAERQALGATTAANEKELQAFAATTDLLPLQQKLAAARVARLEKEVKSWQQEEQRMTEQEAKRKANEARRAAIGADPAMLDLATENKEFAELAESLAKKTRLEIASRDEIQAELDRVEKQYQRAVDHVETVGLTDAIGQLLRTQKTDLPSIGEHISEAQARQSQVRATQIKLFELEDRRSFARTLDQQVEDAIKKVGTLPVTVSPEELESTVRDYLVKREEYLDSAIKIYLEYLREMGESEVVQRQLIQKTEDFSTYIDERVLWIQSAGTLNLKQLRLAGGVLKRGLCPEGWPGWLDVTSTWVNDAQENEVVYFLVAVLMLTWVVARRRIRRYLARLGESAATNAQIRILPTVQALLGTAFFAAAGPALLFYLGLRLTVHMDGTSFVRAVGTGMMYAAEWWFPLSLFKQLCRPNGLAERHFGWPPRAIRALRRYLRWFIMLGTPLVFTMACLEAQGYERWQNSLGRVSFLTLMILSALFAHVVLRPSGKVVRHFQASGKTIWLLRSRRLLHWLAIVSAATLALAAFAGYFYTAYRLGDRVRETVLLVVGLLIASALLSRWVLIVRRRLAIERMRQRRAVEAANTPDGDVPAIASMPTVPVEQEVDLTLVTEQTRRFVNSLLIFVGVLLVWWIWIEVLPALAFFDRVPLWEVTKTVTETITAEDGATSIRTIERPGFISFGDLGLALLVLVMTIVAAKNLPGLLEISIPQQLPLDAGARYAITTLTRYVVVAVGVVLAGSTLGFRLAQVTWLLAALTVGLGFGLQEIFANFISGLILLFERPIRVGDVVTIDEITGVVSRIQIRATTVTNWDRKDFIVPNKEFITGRLLNWTRSDQVNRIVINVGIAYGSDTEKARQLIEQVLHKHQEVLDDPMPIVTFEGFGDSTLDLVVRCYLAKLDNRLQTIHDLHTAIDQAFREAGIEIAFPQRDIHIRSGGEPQTTAQG